MQTNERHGVLIITESPPKSYSPASERLFHMAMASGSVFERVILLSLRGFGRRNQGSHIEQGKNSRVMFYVANFVRAMPYPIIALFDPVKFLVFLVHGFILFKRYKFSFVAASMPPLETGVSAFFLGKLFHAKLLIDLRDDWEPALNTQLASHFPKPLMRIVSRVSKQVYSYSSLMFVVTQTIATAIRNRGIRTNIVVIPNGANTSVFKPQSINARNKIRLQYSLPMNKVMVIYSGSGGSPYYRLDLVLKCLKLLSKNAAETLRFIFYLYDGQRFLDGLRRELAIPDELVEIRDALPRPQLAEILSACDVGLVPFDAKPYLLCARSTKVYEYLSSGLFVIATGPSGGELDSFFSANPKFGLFSGPSQANFAHALLQVVGRTQNLLEDDSRQLRYRFIRENYDRKKLMKDALNNVLLTMTLESKKATPQ